MDRICSTRLGQRIAEAAPTMYCAMRGPSCDATGGIIKITEEYLDANTPVVKRQLEKAGIRLAHLLDTAFQN
jgi:S1/P1 Nuclease